MTLVEYKNLIGDKTLQSRYFDILCDCNPHCRKCAQRAIGSEQLAGGGGVQGLERGSKNRPGFVIETTRQYCAACNAKTRWDRWTGEFKCSNSASGLSPTLQKRIFNYYNYIDSIEQRKRPAHELVIDHRFPMERWGAAELNNSSNMSEDEIHHKFQLLKKDESGNHNLLKSRACEHCIETGHRGYPLGINFFYSGDENWPDDCPASGLEAERGCIGCGWYDFETWRRCLNEVLNHRQG